MAEESAEDAARRLVEEGRQPLRDREAAKLGVDPSDTVALAAAVSAAAAGERAERARRGPSGRRLRCANAGASTAFPVSAPDAEVALASAPTRRRARGRI
ncbi:hypothetical protein [Marinitenerispora sediminis]|uniref:Uncharacterized protein n=1 Tax=Marinitenerispora sediminis TaxID=1931232 RepID=A0A368TAF4_9ACTN|nr:hypothetical protein [Marinitenerispora sediminis]RCV52914.1 hypothetical protein DEF28_11770 [Marinitenerispora sediminis]RCV60731.1 hypothetical protein DEF23_03985 [Marinitenerispora sediminis]RCV61593.1 hypothetical protein DEF24_03890 [Marinitenerispora sediminis]